MSAVEKRISLSVTPLLLRVAVPACLWLLVLIDVVHFLPLLDHQGLRNDFSIYMLSGLAFNAGENPYLTNFDPLAKKMGLEDGSVTHATDPPTFILLFSPISKMTPQKAFWLWTLVNCAALIAAMLLLVGPGSGLSASIGWSFVALVILYPPVLSSFYGGQNKILILLLFALMIRWMRNEHDAAAGFALAAAALTRIFPLLIMGYLLIERRWRILQFTIIGLIVGILVTLIFFGFTNTVSFIRGIGLLTAQRWLSEQRDIALDAYISRWFWTFGGMQKLAPGYEILRRIAIVLADLLILFLTVRATLCVKAGGDHNFRLFSLWVVTSVILSPTAWVHYLVLLLIPFAQIASAYSAQEASPRAFWSAVISVGLIFFTMSPWRGFGHLTNPWLRLTFGEYAFISLAAAYLSAYFFSVDQPHAVRIRLGTVSIVT
jgi:glycosyl transferase family 87